MTSPQLRTASKDWCVGTIGSDPSQISGITPSWARNAGLSMFDVLEDSRCWRAKELPRQCGSTTECMVRPMATKSDRDAERWARFKEGGDHARVRDLVLDVVGAAGLGRQEIGERWGITVHVDSTAFLRLNVADYCLLDIVEPEKSLDDRLCRLAVVIERSSSRFADRRAMRGEGRYWQLRPGFTKYVEESQIVRAQFAEMESLIRRPVIRRGIELHVAVRPKRLYSTDRHNPLTVELFD